MAVCVCVQPVMNLNYVLVWPSGPGYTSRVGDYAQWRNQGVCLLERTLTLLIPRLRPQRWDISVFYLCFPVCPQYLQLYMHIQSLFSICINFPAHLRKCIFVSCRWFIWWKEARRSDGRVWWWRPREDFSPKYPPPASRIPDSLWVSPLCVTLTFLFHVVVYFLPASKC